MNKIIYISEVKEKKNISDLMIFEICTKFSEPLNHRENSNDKKNDKKRKFPTMHILFENKSGRKQ